MNNMHDAHDKGPLANRKAFNRENIGNLIRSRRAECGLSQQNLADQVGVSKVLVSHWEAGRSRPDIYLLPDICAALRITIPQFFGAAGKGSELSTDELRHMQTYRLLSKAGQAVIDRNISALLEYEGEQLFERCKNDFVHIFRNDQRSCAGVVNPLDEDCAGEWIEIRSDALTRKADEIIVVSGDSMEPTFSDGDELLVEHTSQLEYGEIGIFVINGEGFVKEYRENGVYSHNHEKYPLRVLTSDDDVRCIGRVIGKLDQSYYPDEKEQSVLNDIYAE